MSKDHLSSNNSLLHKPLVSLGNLLEDFVCSQPDPACIKIPEKKTQIGKYAVCNEVIAQRNGISIQDYIGLTAYDVGEMMRYEKAVTENTIDIDTKIFNGVLDGARYKQSIPIDGGLFSIEEIIKRPIFSKDNKVIGLFSCGNDITDYVDPLYLFSCYQQHYAPKEAIRHFCRHLKIQHFFYELPTTRELETLLVMRGSNATKYIARTMRLSPKTVEENKARLRNNLKLTTLDDLVTKLRVRNEFQNVRDIE